MPYEGHAGRPFRTKDIHVTYLEKRAVEIWSSNLAEALGLVPPSKVVLSKKRGCIEIHTDNLEMDASDKLAEALSRKITVVARWSVDVSTCHGMILVRDKEKK